MSRNTQSEPIPRRRRRKAASRSKRDPEVVMADPKALRPCAKNARQHSPAQIGQIKSSIEAFGFINPIVIDIQGEVIAGHGRLAAALELGFLKVPVIQADHLSEIEVRAYRLADNKIAENSTWDMGLLQIEVAELMDLEIGGELDFDMHTIGFEVAELNNLLAGDEETGSPEIVATPDAVTVVEIGETWHLGRHQISCGSALAAATLDHLMQGDLAGLIVTDPPYNVQVNGHIRCNNKGIHREFAMASGEMTELEFKEFLENALTTSLKHILPGAIVMTFMDWRHLSELRDAAIGVGLEQLNLCVWVKSNGGMGSLYRSQHELCAIYKLPGDRHQNNVKLGSLGRNRTNVWSYAGVNTFGKNRSADLIDHPTVKPVAMIEDAIRDVTRHGDIVLDPFGGSGTTLIAAERCNRRARLIELDPGYVDVTIRRWQELTGQQAVEMASGVTWDERVVKKSDQALGDSGNG